MQRMQNVNIKCCIIMLSWNKLVDWLIIYIWYLLIWSCRRTSLVCHLTQIGDFCDFQKAFDCCSHRILLIKLSKLEIIGRELKWFENYGIISIYDIFLCAVEAEHHWCATSHKGHIGTLDLVHVTFEYVFSHCLDKITLCGKLSK